MIGWMLLIAFGGTMLVLAAFGTAAGVFGAALRVIPVFVILLAAGWWYIGRRLSL